MKKVLVISTSMRSGANSDTLADEFVKGAKAAKNDAVKINLLGKKYIILQRLFGLCEDS
ncbi:hypothetical protein [Campylobacter hyointestinalis]|uniref:hypothetical protein n=1 Tax=Campylobacter hyointestinalis TaxID=198 RepID=UPI001C8D0CED|nr:hypothetical protein [Campylobacter hyointestinalis]